MTSADLKRAENAQEIRGQRRALVAKIVSWDSANDVGRSADQNVGVRGNGEKGLCR